MDNVKRIPVEQATEGMRIIFGSSEATLSQLQFLPKKKQLLALVTRDKPSDTGAVEFMITIPLNGTQAFILP